MGSRIKTQLFNKVPLIYLSVVARTRPGVNETRDMFNGGITAEHFRSGQAVCHQGHGKVNLMCTSRARKTYYRRVKHWAIMNHTGRGHMAVAHGTCPAHIACMKGQIQLACLNGHV